MVDEQNSNKKCDLTMFLSQVEWLTTSYDTKSGLTRNMRLCGHVHEVDEDYGINEPFHLKTCALHINSPTDQEWLKEVRSSLGDRDAFGNVTIYSGLAPLRLKFVELPPVRVKISISNDMFEALHQQVIEAFDQRRFISANVEFSGAALPDIATSQIFLDDLDISEDKTYPVTHFEFSKTSFLDHNRGRVKQIEKDRDEGHGTYISILITDTKYEINTQNGYASGIKCEGKIVGTQYDGADVTINFDEFEDNQFEELPDRAFYGEFWHWPKKKDENYSSTYFVFELKYVPKDARDLIIPLLNAEQNKRVSLQLNLTNEKEEILNATEKLKGNVRSYRFSVQQSKHCREWLSKIDNELPADEKTKNNTIDLEGMLRRNRNFTLVGVLLQYFGLLWVVLGNMNIIPKNALYSAGAYVEVVAGVVILIYTYKLLKTLGSGVLKRIAGAIVNVFLGLNIMVRHTNRCKSWGI